MGQELVLFGHLRAGTWAGDLHRRHLSSGLSDVSGRVASRRLRLGLYSEEVSGLRIVVWRSPKALCGVLRLLFGIKDAQE